jgi:hypothetical protein
MSLEIIIMLVSFILAVILSASRDKIKDHWVTSIFRYWVQGTKWEYFFNTVKSWENKYKHDEEGNLIPDPKRPGKFLRKTIVLFGWDTGIWLPVVFTDAWHMIKGGEILLYSLSIGLAISVISDVCWLQYWYWNTVALVLVWSILFELFYADWLEKKMQNAETTLLNKIVKNDIKLYLDDVREAPEEGWIVVRDVESAIKFLKTNKVKELSVDHDLGDDTPYTGYDLLEWLEEEVAHGKSTIRVPEKMKIHSANPAVRTKMKQAIESIQRMRRAE